MSKSPPLLFGDPEGPGIEPRCLLFETTTVVVGAVAAVALLPLTAFVRIGDTPADGKLFETVEV